PLDASQFQSLVAILDCLLDGLLPRPVGTREGGECQRIMKAFRCHPICTFLIYILIYKCRSRACPCPRGVRLRAKKPRFLVGAGVDDVWGGDACVALIGVK